MKLRAPLIALPLLLGPALALAHPGHAASGLMAGLAHPLLGLDHLLAMFAIGLWAAQQRDAARWAVPLSFVASLLLGGQMGFAGLQLPLLESGIAGSLLALGLLVALAARLPLAVGAGLAALFGLGHGVAHGLELPAQASPWLYASGFVVASAALHTCGYALALRLPRAAAPMVRLAGAASALGGAWLLAG
ncbi:HupE/UreJ family protein [Pseudomonas zhanjiangensis]|uniref:HupE/UreJ family protein n=1 Tax=Pseudomonas zhanjiangensis TaxID=3239015 RepID=A0ABV3YXZ4_9PSED